MFGRMRCLFTFLFGVSSAVAAVDPAFFQELKWRLIGPFRGGRVLAVSGVPGEPEHFYFGSVNGGVWETRDAGRTWQPIFDSQPIGSIGAIAIAASDHNVIYVGTGAIDLAFEPGNPKVIYAALWQTRRTPWSVYPPSNGPGSGLFKSTDGGDHWNAVPGLPAAKLGRIGIAVAPSMPQRVYLVVD